MKNKKIFGCGLIAVILALTFTACSKSGGGSGGGGKSLNSATELKEYLDKQPANSPDKPIKVAMKINDMMIKDIAKVISEAGKYVSLDLSGSPLTEIPREAFGEERRGCETLVGIIIPNGVTTIGREAFHNTGLTSVTIPNSVTSIEYYAFASTSLTSVTIPNSVTEIEEGAFMYCTSLTSVNIPNSVTSIESWAFGNCSSLTSVTIPNSVTKIGSSAFKRCASLTSVTFQGTITSDNFGFKNDYPFSGDLHDKYFAGGIGTYTTTAPVGNNSVWTKQ